MSSLRQLADDDIKADSLLEASGEIVSIEVDDLEGITVESVISEYPYDQKKYEGVVTYEEPVPGNRFTIDPEIYDFEYRDGSGLLIIDSDISGMTSRTVFREINKELSVDVGRFNRPQTHRLGTWSFVFASRSQPKIIARDFEEQKVNWDEIRNLTQREIAYEYTLDRADLVFYYEDTRIEVGYENGRLNFTKSTPEGREYVIQLFEKYAVAGDVIESLK
ncbi:hypothetical protein [Halorubrum tebenquichense]|uniref:hypothetical protein n=1 Tax=Halorubrum tebenquichense TaxID=119434 RepID=UPI00126965F0|nr:hypothetical protein [Halorubrum tebenquichense]